MQYKLLIIQCLPLLTSAAAIATASTLKAPALAHLSQGEVNQVPFSELSSYPGAILEEIFRTPSNETTNAVQERSADVTTELAKRTIFGPICSGGHTPPGVDDCARVISIWTSIAQDRFLNTDGCDQVTYGNCLGYICATQCNAITYDSDYVWQRLQDINAACVVNQGEAGYYHSTGGTLPDGTGYAKFEIGLERYSGELPPYEPCPRS